MRELTVLVAITVTVDDHYEDARAAGNVVSATRSVLGNKHIEMYSGMDHLDSQAGRIVNIEGKP